MSTRRPCAFLNCPNYHSKDHVYQMFTIPHPGFRGTPEELRCMKWIERTCNPDILNMPSFKVARAQKRVCKDHFTDDQFLNVERNRLKPNQVPLWNVLHNTVDDPCHQPDTLVVPEPPADNVSVIKDLQEPVDRLRTLEELARPEPQTPLLNTAHRHVGELSLPVKQPSPYKQVVTFRRRNRVLFIPYNRCKLVVSLTRKAGETLTDSEI